MERYETQAIESIRKRAKATEGQDLEEIRQMLGKNGCAHVEPEDLAKRLISACNVTLNFHPDRISNNGEWIIQNMLDEGRYKSQFSTGTTNGGRTAYPGGDRDEWERDLFSGSYHRERTADHRPKYGALNVLHYTDGASARFGSCFVTLKPQTVSRCTFAFGDSSSHPEALGTSDAFYATLRAILQEIKGTGRFLNRAGYTVNSAVKFILSVEKDAVLGIGRNLDDCVEAHVHGDILFQDDMESISMDESFLGTKTEALAHAFSKRYGASLHRIPARTLPLSQIGPDFRGPAIPPLAERIIAKFGGPSDILHAERIGRASRDMAENPDDWLDLGDEPALFQSVKQLWHTLAFFG